MRASIPTALLSHLLLGRQGLLVRIHSIIVIHVILTTITPMRPFYIRLPVGSRLRLRSYTASTCTPLATDHASEPAASQHLLL